MSAQLKAALGRDFAGRRFGPRPLDLDIIFYGDQDFQHDRLSVPHPRWQERDFVKAPLADLFAPEENMQNGPCRGLANRLADVHQTWKGSHGNPVEHDMPDWPGALSQRASFVHTLCNRSLHRTCTYM